MLRSTGMHVNCRAQFGEPPRRPRVIKVNVAQKNVANVLHIKSSFPKCDHYIVERRFRTGIEKCDSFAGFKSGCGDDANVTELARIQNVNFHGRYFFEMATT